MPKNYRSVLDTLDSIDALYRTQGAEGTKEFKEHVLSAYSEIARFTVTVTLDEAKEIFTRLCGHFYGSRLVVSQGPTSFVIYAESDEDLENIDGFDVLWNEQPVTVKVD